jgi:hypothetical protein
MTNGLQVGIDFSQSVGPVFSSGVGAEIGDTQRFLQGRKWDRKRKRYRPRNLRDAEDIVAKIAGLWWPPLRFR